MTDKEWEKCDNCGQRVTEGYMNQHKGSIRCEAKGKMKEMREKGYKKVKHPTYVNKLRTQGKTEVAPARIKTINVGKHNEHIYKLGHWAKEEDFEEVRKKYLRDYKDRPKTHKLYENEDYVLCNVDGGTIFKKIDERRGEKSKKRKFRYVKRVVARHLKKGTKYKTEIYTLDGEKFAEEIDEKEKENIEDKELINRYVITGL